MSQLRGKAQAEVRVSRGVEGEELSRKKSSRVKGLEGREHGIFMGLLSSTGSILPLPRGRAELPPGVWVTLFERKILPAASSCVLRGKAGKIGERRKICG